ncbi:hypothetical protein [Rheinheimera mangrovi]|uniref:hypothetical protein n=1 Tax=Rheinheimera mangrovi TaxID=2498451 RepID=UPI000F8CCDA5|nr:hypothetical protein [Rheinheimera mangrovi]
MLALNNKLLLCCHPWRLAGWGCVLSVLLIPLVAMQFTTEVQWTGGDFLVAAILLCSTGLCIELAVKYGRNGAARAGWALVVLTSLLMTWLNLAVGIIGSENNPLNQIYFLVVVLVVLGSLWARFRPQAMSRVLWLTAAAQMGIELLIQLTDSGAAPVLNTAFALLWLLAAALLRYSPALSSAVKPEA